MRPGSAGLFGDTARKMVYEVDTRGTGAAEGVQAGWSLIWTSPYESGRQKISRQRRRNDGPLFRSFSLRNT